MPHLEWLGSYEFGAPEIDDGHRALLGVMRDIDAAVETGDVARAFEQLGQLVRVAEDHFETEEAFLTRVGYDAVEAHATYHRDLLARVKGVHRDCAGQDDKNVFVKFYEKLTTFLVDDIVRGDLQFKSYLEEQGFTRRD